MSKRSLVSIWIVLLATLLVPPGVRAARDVGFVIIVNAKNSTESLSRQEIARMFLKQRVRWDHGERVRPVDLSETWEVRSEFSVAIFRRTTLDIEEHWEQMVFSGRDVPPPKKGSEQEVLEYVAEHPGAIGYVSRGVPLIDGVKVIAFMD